MQAGAASAAEGSFVRHEHIQLRDVRLHYVEAGRGPMVVLLHGFPDFWYTWRHQIPALAAQGFRVVAPDLRGYNLSDKPKGVRAYGVRSIVADVAELVRALGASKVSVVGHDWGAGVAWSFAMTHPELVERLAVLNGPHPQRMLEAMKDPVQLAKSWYVFLFQLPWLPEMLLRRRHFAWLLRALQTEPTRPGAFDAEDRRRYVEALSRPGALTAAVNYYRAMFRPGTRPALRRIDAPVLVLWGDRDAHLRRELATPPKDLVPQARVEHLPGASHWLHHDEPERVSRELARFLRGADVARA